MGSPAQPLLDLYRNVGNKVQNGINALPAPPPWFYGLFGMKSPETPDTTWHDSMVRQANQAFQNQQPAQTGSMISARRKK